jgi:hypothetical protein
MMDGVNVVRVDTAPPALPVGGIGVPVPALVPWRTLLAIRDIPSSGPEIGGVGIPISYRRPAGVRYPLLLLLVGVVAAVAIAGVSFYVGRWTSPTHPTTKPSLGQTGPSTSPVLTTSSTLAPATLFTAPPDTSVIPTNGRSGVFAGNWYAHSTFMSIATSGQGTLTYRIYKTCDGSSIGPCDVINGDVIDDGGFVTFTLTATGPTTASGMVSLTTDPTNSPLGKFTARFVPQTDQIYLSFVVSGNYPLCGPNARSGACGA